NDGPGFPFAQSSRASFGDAKPTLESSVFLLKTRALKNKETERKPRGISFRDIATAFCLAYNEEEILILLLC
ncbi:MAG: hypothetical protein ACKN85_03370, partial [Pirellula sp.]